MIIRLNLIAAALVGAATALAATAADVEGLRRRGAGRRHQRHVGAPFRSRRRGLGRRRETRGRGFRADRAAARRSRLSPLIIRTSRTSRPRSCGAGSTSTRVDAIADGGNSATALAIQGLTRDKKRIFLISGPGSSDLTGKQCSPYGFHFTYDTYAEALRGREGALF